ncbi:hypothetical protein [Chitinophaga deserti]|uniref:hypothetical protein n=1 Tax=Chitinophaga deserti TaxID=2164099 RepID=UPI0013005083|nr:hypothetical protein [Chitinophaga deserti]
MKHIIELIDHEIAVDRPVSTVTKLTSQFHVVLFTQRVQTLDEPYKTHSLQLTAATAFDLSKPLV